MTTPSAADAPASWSAAPANPPESRAANDANRPTDDQSEKTMRNFTYELTRRLWTRRRIGGLAGLALMTASCASTPASLPPQATSPTPAIGAALTGPTTQGCITEADNTSKKQNTQRHRDVSRTVRGSAAQNPPQARQCGTQNSAGPHGAPGPQGPRGRQGPAGPQGPQGPHGRQGPRGPQGATGPQGPTGRQGAPGPAGTSGAPGAPGPHGASAPPPSDQQVRAAVAFYCATNPSHCAPTIVQVRAAVEALCATTPTTCDLPSAPQPSQPSHP